MAFRKTKAKTKRAGKVPRKYNNLSRNCFHNKCSLKKTNVSPSPVIFERLVIERTVKVKRKFTSRAFLVHIWSTVCPEKVARVDEILKKYKGREISLVEAVAKKYNVNLRQCFVDLRSAAEAAAEASVVSKVAAKHANASVNAMLYANAVIFALSAARSAAQSAKMTKLFIRNYLKEKKKVVCLLKEKENISGFSTIGKSVAEKLQQNQKRLSTVESRIVRRSLKAKPIKDRVRRQRQRAEGGFRRTRGKSKAYHSKCQ
eukprot:g4169.t1